MVRINSRKYEQVRKIETQRLVIRHINTAGTIGKPQSSSSWESGTMAHSFSQAIRVIRLVTGLELLQLLGDSSRYAYSVIRVLVLRVIMILSRLFTTYKLPELQS